MADIDYREHPAAPALSRFVEALWLIEAGYEVNHPVPPDGCVDLVYSRELGLRYIGAMTTEQNFRIAEGTAVAGVRFRPGMARLFLKEPLATLTDTHFPADDLWPKRWRSLESRLQELQTKNWLETLHAALEAPLAKPTSVQLAIEEITRRSGTVDLGTVAVQANLSSRQFQRRCLEESGLAPKRLCRVLRFRYARQLAFSNQRPIWSAIAAQAGYFDQAHLIRDFQEFSGRSPMSVLSNTGPQQAR